MRARVAWHTVWVMLDAACITHTRKIWIFTVIVDGWCIYIVVLRCFYLLLLVSTLFLLASTLPYFSSFSHFFPTSFLFVSTSESLSLLLRFYVVSTSFLLRFYFANFFGPKQACLWPRRLKLPLVAPTLQGLPHQTEWRASRSKRPFIGNKPATPRFTRKASAASNACAASAH
jgi:hypothetical protein